MIAINEIRTFYRLWIWFRLVFVWDMGEGTLVKSLCENSLGEVGHLVKHKIFSWKFESNGEMKNHLVKNNFFWEIWMKNFTNWIQFHEVWFVPKNHIKSYNSSIIPRISRPLSAWNNESKCLKEHDHCWKNTIMAESIRSWLTVCVAESNRLLDFGNIR